MTKPMYSYSLLSEIFWIGTTTFAFLILYDKIKNFAKNFAKSNQNLSMPNGMKKVPIVPGGLPLIGHGLTLYFKNVEFIRDCYEKYGGIFQVKIFRLDIIVVCDRDLVLKYLRVKENILSFFHAVSELNFDWTIFEPNLLNFDTATKMFKICMSHKQNLLSERMEEKWTNLIDTAMKRTDGATINIGETMRKYVLISTMAAFVPGIPTDEPLIQDLCKFYDFSDKLIVGSHFLPKWILQFCTEWKIKKFKRSLVLYFVSEVQKYRDDPSLVDSILIRMAMDVQEEGKEKLTNSKIAEIITGFLYFAITNSTLALVNVLTNLALAENATWLKEIREECELNSGDAKLHGFIIETIRLTSQIMSLHRKPEFPDFCLGEYFIGNKVDNLVISPQIIQVFGRENEKNPMEFFPQRFIGENSEPQTWPDIIAWGGGKHACPGRTLALNQIKMAVSQILMNFELEIDKKSLPPLSYFDVVAIGKRKLMGKIRYREKLLDV